MHFDLNTIFFSIFKSDFTNKLNFLDPFKQNTRLQGKRRTTQLEFKFLYALEILRLNKRWYLYYWCFISPIRIKSKSTSQTAAKGFRLSEFNCLLQYNSLGSYWLEREEKGGCYVLQNCPSFHPEADQCWPIWPLRLATARWLRSIGVSMIFTHISYFPRPLFFLPISQGH